MTTACQVVEIARGELNTVESPPDSNKQKYGVWYGMNGLKWCAMFVVYVFYHAGMDLRTILGRGLEFTPTFAALGRKAGLEVPVREVRAGDIVLFKFGSRISHVGICVEDGVKPGDLVVTIEGNTAPTVKGSQDNGGGVFQRVRPLSSIACVLRPPFAACAAAPAPIPEADVPALVKLAEGIRESKKLVLRKGAKGPAVVFLQTKLGIKADGDFGPVTFKAVKAWQRSHGLVADGVVGPATWASLYPGV